MSLATAPLRVLEALATPHGLDRYLELVDPMLTVRELRARVVEIQRHPHSVTLMLRPNHRMPRLRAGQHVQVAVDIDGVRHTRCYSPACSEHRADRLLEITVKTHDPGVVSQHLRAHARPGLVVGLSAPQGTFMLPDPRPDDVLLISGGSGITPVMAMLRTLCDERHPGRIGFLHYAPAADHVAYLDDLRTLEAEHANLAVRICHTRNDAGDLAGRFGAAHLDSAAPWYADAQTFVCGPQPLMDAVAELYAAAGLADRLHTEAFTLTPLRTAADGKPEGTVSFASSDVNAPNTGATLLEQAEAAGLSPDFGCRMGICFTCTTPRRSGCTRDIRTGEISSDPDTEIQLCVSVPVGDVAVDV
jgi:ferredoxin-NADP reductase